MQATGGQPLEISAPQYFFLNAPFVMKDFEHFMRVWQGPLGTQARELVEKNGNQTYLGIVYRGLRQTTWEAAVGAGLAGEGGREEERAGGFFHQVAHCRRETVLHQRGR